jgi:hypothetical protein
MSNLLTRFRDLPNIGVIDVIVPNNVLSILHTGIDKMLDSNFNHSEGFQSNLLGHLGHEYVADKDSWNAVEPMVLELAKIYDEKWNYTSQVDIGMYQNNRRLKLKNLWVNFQRKHEFNPPHVHTGIFSFVIWIKIPYELENEDKVFPDMTSESRRVSKFTFHYSNIVGSHNGMVVPVDKTFEGKMLFFPATLSHSVNPFYTSDDYRISIAGNIGVDA